MGHWLKNMIAGVDMRDSWQINDPDALKILDELLNMHILPDNVFGIRPTYKMFADKDREKNVNLILADGIEYDFYYKNPDPYYETNHLRIPYSDIYKLGRALAYIFPEFVEVPASPSDKPHHFNLEPTSMEYLLAPSAVDKLSESTQKYVCMIYDLWKDPCVWQKIKLDFDSCKKIASIYKPLAEACKTALSNKIKTPRTHFNATGHSDEFESMLEDAIFNMHKEKSERSIVEAGEKGEQEVDYVIGWLDEGYTAIKKSSVNKYGKKCILLSDNKGRIQEIDHIVIGSNGIFLIETKNYVGLITIDDQGNWIREKEGTREGMLDPSQQARRHALIMKSLIGEKYPIHSIICFSNPKVQLQGLNNSSIPVVKADHLDEYIRNKKAARLLSQNEINEIIETINKHMVYS